MHEFQFQLNVIQGFYSILLNILCFCYSSIVIILEAIQIAQKTEYFKGHNITIHEGSHSAHIYCNLLKSTFY